MTLTEKLDVFMKEHGKNKLSLSKDAGIPYTTIISFYEKGVNNIKLSTLQKLANHLGCSIDYLTNDKVKARKDLSPAKEQHPVSVPILGYIRAGVPILSEQNMVGEVNIPVDMEDYCDFALHVRGDSMIGAGIMEGDIVLCKSNQTPASGDIVIALIDGYETTLKYYLRAEGKDLLRAANPAYSDIELQAGAQIQGRVIKIYKDPPSYNFYRDYLALQEESHLDWNSVMEKALGYGLKPGNLSALLDSLYTMSKK